MSNYSLQPALISRVIPGSIAEDVGFERGDRIVAINTQRPRDLIDYRFLCADEDLTLEVLDAQGQTHRVELEKEIDDDLGLEFETALFDGLIQCNNRCPFCFIDQQPPGRRSTLYFKDDDYRLSFLYGSYLTLTNLMPAEWERIERLRLSPLYVSVHATDPDVRIRLLKNKRAGLLKEQLAWFAERRLQIHAQVVVCPGINNGPHLEQTLLDLAQFHHGDIPAVASVAVVPVGLTRFRPSTDELIPVDPACANAVIHLVQGLQAQFQLDFGSTFAWLADEWYLIAGQDLPAVAHYETYPQIDNGVGSIRQFLQQFETAAQTLPDSIQPQRRLTWVVGNTVEKAFQPILTCLNQVQGLTLEMVALASQYWGQTMTVTGLITGQDIVQALQGQNLGDGLLLPALMLKYGTTQFLDDMTVEQVAAALQVPIYPVGGGATDLIAACVNGGRPGDPDHPLARIGEPMASAN